LNTVGIIPWKKELEKNSDATSKWMKKKSGKVDILSGAGNDWNNHVGNAGKVSEETIRKHSCVKNKGGKRDGRLL